MTYEEAVEHAKDCGVTFGIYSKEYAEAVKEMNRLWLVKKSTLQNKLAKAIWHRHNKKS